MLVRWRSSASWIDEGARAPTRRYRRTLAVTGRTCRPCGRRAPAATGHERKNPIDAFLAAEHANARV